MSAAHISDYCFCYKGYIIRLFQNLKFQACSGDCAAWFVLDMLRNPEDGVCHGVAHIVNGNKTTQVNSQ